jgi:hypothetical protein
MFAFLLVQERGGLDHVLLQELGVGLSCYAKA